MVSASCILAYIMSTLSLTRAHVHMVSAFVHTCLHCVYIISHMGIRAHGEAEIFWSLARWMLCEHSFLQIGWKYFIWDPLFNVGHSAHRSQDLAYSLGKHKMRASETHDSSSLICLNGSGRKCSKARDFCDLQDGRGIQIQF